MPKAKKPRKLPRVDTIKTFANAANSIGSFEDFGHAVKLLTLVTNKATDTYELCFDPSSRKTPPCLADGNWGTNQEMPSWLAGQWLALLQSPGPDAAIRSALKAEFGSTEKVKAFGVQLLAWHRDFDGMSLEDYDSNWEKASKLVAMSIATAPLEATPTSAPPATVVTGAGGDKKEKRAAATALFPIFAAAKKAKPAASKTTTAAKTAAPKKVPKPTQYGIRMSRTSRVVEWDDETFTDCRPCEADDSMTEHNEATAAQDQKDVDVLDFDAPMGPMDSESVSKEPVFASAESANRRASELVETFKAGLLAEEPSGSLRVDPKQPASAAADKDEVKNGLASCTRKIALFVDVYCGGEFDNKVVSTITAKVVRL